MGERMEAGLLLTVTLLMCTCAIFSQIYKYRVFLNTDIYIKAVRFYQDLHQQFSQLQIQHSSMYASRTLLRFASSSRNLFKFSTSQAKQGNFIWAFIRSAWRQTFPNDQEQINNKYKKVKRQKRYTQEQLEEMQGEIAEYKRTAMVQVKGKENQKNSFKVGNLIPDGVKNTAKNTQFYKQYKEFSTNLKEYLETSDSVPVNLGNKVYSTLNKPSTTARATEIMRKYDEEFNFFELQKQAGYLFQVAYNFFLMQNVEELEKLCGQRALDLFKSLIKMNQIKKVRQKFPEIIDLGQSNHLKTVMAGENELPTFVFQIKIQEVYCMIDYAGKIVDGDEDRIMSSTYHFCVSYAGDHLEELGHPWKITEVSKVDELKLLV